MAKIKPVKKTKLFVAICPTSYGNSYWAISGTSKALALRNARDEEVQTPVMFLELDLPSRTTIESDIPVTKVAIPL